MTDQPQQPTPIFGDLVVAKAGSYYRNTRYLMAVMCIVGGVWFGLDGWKNWPESNRRAAEADTNLKLAQQANDTDKIRQFSEEQKEFKRHSERDIWLQKVLAIALPPLGLFVLGWSLYKTRGQYRLAGTTLSIPGHPDVSFDDITKIDKQKWDRKGIVHLHYAIEKTNQSGIITLDDFLYDRPPTDEIFKRVENYLLPAATQPE